MSSFGTVFKVHTFGESHCKAVGVIIDGCPPLLPLTESDIQVQLNRRRPGQSELTTSRNEQDTAVILSGTENGVTLGTPIAIMVNNQDQRPGDYKEMLHFPRPSHADYTYMQKYGIKASSGGGRSSARETIGRVAGGAVAEKLLAKLHDTEVVAFVESVGPISLLKKFNLEMNEISHWSKLWDFLANVKREDVDSTLVRCPDKVLAKEMERAIAASKEGQNSIGGCILCVIRNVPAGLGEPCFDKLEAKLGHAMLSIPSTKGFEIGSGFLGTKLAGSVHNDPFTVDGLESTPEETFRRKLNTVTNFSGGIQGGISNGQNIYFRVAFKPPATIGLPQNSTDFSGNSGVLEAKGRHDPCVVPRAVAIVESMASLVVMDALLQQSSRTKVLEELIL